MPVILALDQGTTSSRAIVFDHAGSIVSVAQQEFRQIFPQAGWVEHDAAEIWATQLAVARQALDRAGAAGRATSPPSASPTSARRPWSGTAPPARPIHNAIVWQDRRTAGFCDALKAQRARPGHPAEDRPGDRRLLLRQQAALDPRQRARARAPAPSSGELAFGTIDTWLVWKLTGGALHVTDVSNASRTMLFNIATGDWDDELLEWLGVPRAVLPAGPRPRREVFGDTAPDLFDAPIPIAGHRGRPAGGAVRPAVLRARPGQEHLRHRLLHADEHRRASRSRRSTGC